MPDQSIWIEKMELQGFRVFLQKQTFSLASNGSPLSLAIFGPNAKGKSSLVDSIEYYFSSDSTLERLGRRTLQTHAGPIAVEHVDAQDEGINTKVHFWFRQGAEKFDEERPVASPIPGAASRILSIIKVPFVIRGHELRRFVEETTPGDQYKELANWFGLDPLLKIQQNLRTLRRRVKERADSTAAADERSRDLTLLTEGKIVTWDEQGVCNWFNNILASLDDSLAFTSFSGDDPTLAILCIRKEAEQEQLGLAQLRRASSLLKELDSPPEGTDKEHGGKLVSFERATLRLREAVVHEGIERSKASVAVFSQVWNDAKKLFDDGNILGICPVCDTDLSVGPHGSHAGVRTSIDARLSGLADYREAEQELNASRRQVGQSLEPLRNSVGAAITTLVDAGYDHKVLSEYLEALSRWNVGDVQPASEDARNTLSTAQDSIANKIRQIEGQHGERTYANALDTANKLFSIKADLERITRTKAQLESLHFELDRQVLVIEKAIVDHIQSLIGTLQADVADLYQGIQGIGGFAPSLRIELPDQDHIDQQRAQLLIDFSHNREGVVPSGYLSDSQVHTLALALRLAAIRTFNSEAPILVLDDVVTSYDADHRKTIASVLANHFSDYQIVLVTHDEQFFSLLKDQLPQARWVFKRITEVRAGFEPVFHDHQTSDELIQGKLGAGESAGAEIRQAEEEWLLRICREFGAKVTIRPIERAFQYDRAELAESLASFLRGAGIRPPESSPASNGFLNSLRSGVVENLASHFSDNPYRSNSVGDDRARWEEFKFFRNLFKCPSCAKRRFKRPVSLRKPVCYYCETQFAFSLASNLSS